MILEIALGIIIACVVLSMGGGAVGIALIVAAFAIGFGWLVILGAVLWCVIFVLAFIFDPLEREAIMLSWRRRRRG